MSGNVDLILKMPQLTTYDTGNAGTVYKTISKNKISLPKSSTGSQILKYLKYSAKMKEIRDDSVILVESAEIPGQCSILNPDDKLGTFTEADRVSLLIYPPALGLTIITPNNRKIHREYNYTYTAADLIEYLSNEKYNFKYPVEYNLFYYPQNPFSSLKSMKSLYDQFPAMTHLYLRRKFWINPLTSYLNVNELEVVFSQAVEMVLDPEWVPRAIDVNYLSCILIRYDTAFFSKDLGQIKKHLKADNPKKELVLSKHLPYIVATDAKAVKAIKNLIVEDKNSLSTKDSVNLKILFLKECGNDPFFGCQFFPIFPKPADQMEDAAAAAGTEKKSKSKSKDKEKSKHSKSEFDSKALKMNFPPGSLIFTITRDALYGIDPVDFAIVETIQLTKFRKLNPLPNLQFVIYYYGSEKAKNIQAWQFYVESHLIQNCLDEYVSSFLMALASITKEDDKEDKMKEKSQAKAQSKTAIATPEKGSAHSGADVSILSFPAPKPQQLFELPVPLATKGGTETLLSAKYHTFFDQSNEDYSNTYFQNIGDNSQFLSDSNYSDLLNSSEQLLNLFISPEIADDLSSFGDSIRNTSAYTILEELLKREGNTAYATLLNIISVTQKVGNMDSISPMARMKNILYAKINNQKLTEACDIVSPQLSMIAKTLAENELTFPDTFLLSVGLFNHDFNSTVNSTDDELSEQLRKNVFVENYYAKSAPPLILFLEACTNLAKTLGAIGINQKELARVLKMKSIIPTVDLLYALDLSSALKSAYDELMKPENQEYRDKFLNLPHHSNITFPMVEKIVNDLSDFMKMLSSPTSLLVLTNSDYLKKPFKTPTTLTEVIELYERVQAIGFVLRCLNARDTAVLGGQLSGAAAKYISQSVSSFKLAIKNHYDTKSVNLKPGYDNILQFSIDALEFLKLYELLEKILKPDDAAEKIAIDLIQAGEEIPSVLSLLAIDSYSINVKKTLLRETIKKMDAILRAKTPDQSMCEQLGEYFKTLSFCVISLAKSPKYKDSLASIKEQFAAIGNGIARLIHDPHDLESMKDQFSLLKSLLRALEGMFYDVDEGLKSLFDKNVNKNVYTMMYEIPHNKNDSIMNLLSEASELLSEFKLD